MPDIIDSVVFCIIGPTLCQIDWATGAFEECERLGCFPKCHRPLAVFPGPGAVSAWAFDRLKLAIDTGLLL